MKLYSYWRSSASYRVRIALHLKGLPFETVDISLLDGAQQQSAYTSHNPQGLVPYLEDSDIALGQSHAIIEYLEESYPQPQLLPLARQERAYCRELANLVCCDIHPLCNLRVLNYLSGELKLNDKAKMDWYRVWVEQGFQAVEVLLERRDATHFCIGEHASLADCCLIPQVYNARRFNIPLDAYPRIRAIDKHCCDLAPFKAAAPEQNQAEV